MVLEFRIGRLLTRWRLGERLAKIERARQGDLGNPFGPNRFFSRPLGTYQSRSR
jgi:hypothetical protein